MADEKTWEYVLADPGVWLGQELRKRARKGEPMNVDVTLCEAALENACRHIGKLNDRLDEAQEKECGHAGYSWKDHGRCCFRCGAFMVDPGD